MGEGAGCLILESLDHAVQRKANIYGEILGVASTSDANHITNPATEGDGANRFSKLICHYISCFNFLVLTSRCMTKALKNANLQPNDVTYINTHATSTPVGDQAEINAIKRVFPNQLIDKNIYISSFKGSLGHLLGAAGAVETILTVLTAHHKVAIPTKNLHHIDSKLEMEATPFLKILRDADRVSFADSSNGSRFISLKNSFGFGGTNASVCLSDKIS
jgi:3-oxoacyl-[acyl-carrier-protein] synthase II